MEEKAIIRKTILVFFGLVIGIVAGTEFYQHRHHQETVVLTDQVEVKKLGASRIDAIFSRGPD